MTTQTLPNDPSVTVEEHYGYCPVQISGKIDGLDFYLRMRDSISFAVADPGHDPVAVQFGKAPGWYCDEESHYEIGKPIDDAENSHGHPGYATKEE